MTKQELNRDIKRLWKRFQATYGKESLTEEEAEAQRVEWRRLWFADREAEAMKVEQLKAMIRMNEARRYITLHTIALYFEPKF
jgi:hypothetical protein